MTHAELVLRAAAWLRTTKRCSVVFSEHTAGTEFPDAIGWKTGFSYLVECKVSRPDFFADQRKPSRLRGRGGRPAFECWYLTPPGLVSPGEISPWWGLLEARPRLVRVVKRPLIEPFDDREAAVLRQEIYRLSQEVRRYQVQGLRPKPLAQFMAERRAVRGSETNEDPPQ